MLPDEKDIEVNTKTKEGVNHRRYFGSSVCPNWGASRHRLPDRRVFSTSNHSSSDSDAENEEGVSSSYRSIDVNLLSATLSDIHKCPEGLLLF